MSRLSSPNLSGSFKELAGFMVSISYLVVYTSITKKYIIERENKNEK